MAISKNSYQQKMGSSCLQILDPKIWLSSEISDQKTWHAHPGMQTWQVHPWDKIPTILGLFTNSVTAPYEPIQIISVLSINTLHSMVKGFPVYFSLISSIIPLRRRGYSEDF